MLNQTFMTPKQNVNLMDDWFISTIRYIDFMNMFKFLSWNNGENVITFYHIICNLGHLKIKEDTCLINLF